MIACAGKIVVATPGTPVSVVSNLPLLDRGNKYKIHGVLFQALRSNSGVLYIGLFDMDVSALTNVFVGLPIPTDNTLPTFSVALTIAPNSLCLNDFYIDGQADDGVLVTYLVT